MTRKEQAPAERSGGKEGGLWSSIFRVRTPGAEGAGGGNPWGTEGEHMPWDHMLFHENIAQVVKGAR